MTTTESYGCDKHGEDAYQGCAMCDLETLRERLHEAELVAASWKREAELNEQAANESSAYAKRLAEADALRETRAKELSYVVEACTAALVIRTTHESRDALRDLRAWATNRIDAHLAEDA